MPRNQLVCSFSGVIHRALQFAPDAGVPSGLFDDAGGDSRFRAMLPPGVEREQALEQMKTEFAARAAGLEDHAENLRDLVVTHDPTQLLPSIAVPASSGLVGVEAEDDAQETFTWDAKIEYLLGLALSAERGSQDVDHSTTERAVALLAKVFDAATARLFLQQTSEEPTERAGVDESSYLLRMEHLNDRMAGYACHLEQIDDEVFERHRAFYCAELGFCPSDIVRLVRRHTAWVNAELNEGGDALLALYGQDGDTEPAAAATRLYGALEATYRWNPDRLAPATNLPAREVQSILHAMSTDFGCQPGFRLPFDTNAARTRPVVRLGENEYLVLLPWSIAHGVHEWLRDCLRATGNSNVATKYPQHRSAAAERLVEHTLSEVFSPGAVHASQHYDCPSGSGEIDCLVAAATPLLVEVKSRSLTEQGRTGHRPRIARVADDVVIEAVEQTERATQYILGHGGREFSKKQGGVPTRLLPEEVGETVQVTVTLDRMDPIALSAPDLAGEANPPCVWMTNVADLLMVSDVLTDPASFMHYARTRARAAELGVGVFTESDALGAFLVDRLTPAIDRAEADPGVRLLLGYSSAEINNYFTLLEVGMNAERPDISIPVAVLDALAECSDDYSEAWTRAATAVVGAMPDTWATFRRFVRKHRSEHPFGLPNGRARIIASPIESEPRILVEPTPTLVIPRTWII